MKKITFIVLLITVSFFLFSEGTEGLEDLLHKEFGCSLEEFSKTDSGLKYLIKNETSDKKAVAGDFVTVHYLGILPDGTKFDSSYDRKEPIRFELGIGRVIVGWEEGISLLKKGEKALLIIPPDLGYGNRNIGIIPANSTLIFQVELVDITDPPTIEAYDITGKVISETESGLKFILIHKTNGIQAAAGNTVTVHYSGYLEDGSMFDSSLKIDQPFQFLLGAGQVIPGWDEGISLMKKGEKARLIIPSSLAYGDEGIPGIIPEKATLIFDVELLDVK